MVFGHVLFVDAHIMCACEHISVRQNSEGYEFGFIHSFISTAASDIILHFTGAQGSVVVSSSDVFSMKTP
jgi:hypothetical protein